MKNVSITKFDTSKIYILCEYADNTEERFSISEYSDNEERGIQVRRKKRSVMFGGYTNYDAQFMKPEVRIQGITIEDIYKEGMNIESFIANLKKYGIWDRIEIELI